MALPTGICAGVRVVWAPTAKSKHAGPPPGPPLFPLERFLACSTNLASFCIVQGLHSASIPGILALDLCPSDTNKILTGKGASVSQGIWWQQRACGCLGAGPFVLLGAELGKGA